MSVTPMRPDIVTTPMLAERNQEVVDLLRKLLEEAEDGLIQEIAVAASDGNHHTIGLTSGVVSMMLLGAVTLLQHDMMMAWNTVTDEPVHRA
jgi:2-oxoglutarate dehydrogenase complex dehydrogenase (E1) component-like enzyme